MLVIGVAAYFPVAGAAAHRPGRPAPVRRAIWAELAITAIVLGLSASLVQTTRDRTAISDTPGAESGYFSTTLTSPTYTPCKWDGPAERGNTPCTSTRTPSTTARSRCRVAGHRGLPSAGIEPIDVPLLPLTDTHATGEINLPAAGGVAVRVTVRTSDIDQAHG